MPELPDHPYIETIVRYYGGCNTADIAVMESTFTEDVVHYFVDHPPVAGRRGLATYWAKVGPRTRAHWTVDHAIVDGDEAVEVGETVHEDEADRAGVETRHVEIGMVLFEVLENVDTGAVVLQQVVTDPHHRDRNHADAPNIMVY